MKYLKYFFVLSICIVFYSAAYSGSTIFNSGLFFDKPTKETNNLKKIDNSTFNEKLKIVECKYQLLKMEPIYDLGINFPATCFNNLVESAVIKEHYLLFSSDYSNRNIHTFIFSSLEDNPIYIGELKKGQGPTQFSQISNMSFMGTDLLCAYYMGKLVVYDWTYNMKGVASKQLDRKFSMVDVVTYKNNINIFNKIPDLKYYKTEGVEFFSSYAFKDGKISEPETTFLKPDEAEIIFGLPYTDIIENQNPFMHSLNTIIIPGFSEEFYYYLNPVSGVFLKGSFKSEKAVYTLFDRNKTNYLFERTTPDGVTHKCDGCTDSVIRRIKKNTQSEEIWILRNNVDDAHVSFPVYDSGKNKKHPEHYPIFDILDKNMNYKCSYSLTPPPGYQEFTIINFICLSDKELFVIAAVKKEDVNFEGMQVYRVMLEL